MRHRPAEYRRVVAFNQALNAFDHTDPHDQSASDCVVRAVTGEGADFEKWGVGV